MGDETKTCPRCAETVKAAAAVCRFCGYNFSTSWREPSGGRQTFGDAVSGAASRTASGFFGCFGVLIAFGAVLAISQCDSTDGTSSSDVETSPPLEVAASAPPQAPRFDPAKVELAKKEIAKEPKVLDFAWVPENAVELTVAVKDDGTRRYGYAGYFCLKAREWGIYDDDLDVRIVDAAQVVQSNGDWGSISLGWVHCADNTFMD